jgi:hypothetical protein
MSEISFKILHINRNEEERKEFEHLLDFQNKCFNEFKATDLTSQSFLLENISKYQELLGINNPINLEEIENPFDVLINGANLFFNTTDCHESISEIVSIVIYFKNTPIGFIFVWNNYETYAVQHIQNLIPYYIANSFVKQKIPFASLVFDYVFDYIRKQKGKILCVRPINKMIQFVEKNNFKKLLLKNIDNFSNKETEIFTDCSFLYKYPFRTKKIFLQNPDTNIIVDYVYYIHFIHF